MDEDDKYTDKESYEDELIADDNARRFAEWQSDQERPY